MTIILRRNGGLYYAKIGSRHLEPVKLHGFLSRVSQILASHLYKTFNDVTVFSHMDVLWIHFL